MHKQVSAEWQRKAVVIEAEGTAQSIRMYDDALSSASDNTLKNLSYFFGGSNSIEHKTQSVDDDRFLIAKNRFRDMQEPDVFHIELLLPDFLSVQDLFREVEGVTKAVDFIYSFMLILYLGDDDLVNELIGLLRTAQADEKVKSISYTSLAPFLYSAEAESLLVVSSHYGSPASFDLLGVGKVLEILRDIVKDILWHGKYEKQMAELERKNKESSLEKLTLENEQMRIDIISKQLSIVEQMRDLKLSPKDRKLIVSAILPKVLTISDSKISPQLMFTNDGETKRLPGGSDKIEE